MGTDLHRSGEPRADRRADYAAHLASAGDHAAAADLMRQALDFAPGWAAGWVALGDHLGRAGLGGAAIDAYRHALALDALDGCGAGLKLAALGAAETPGSAPPAFVRGLFDQYAEGFEASLVGKLGYAAPARMLDALRAVAGPDMHFAQALDLGCGTGLMGEQVRPVAGRLTGVDLSPAMLAKARRKGLYDRLVEADIAAFDAGAERYDLVTAADVLIYGGDLRALFARIAAMLVPGALFAFTVEAHDGPEAYVLRPSLRYAHSEGGVDATLRAAGMAVRSRSRAALRTDRGQPVEGFLFIAASVSS